MLQELGKVQSSLPRSVCGQLGVEIAHIVKIGEQPGAGWAPSQPFLSLHARTGNVATNEPRQKAEMGCRFLRRFGHDWHLQASADGLSDVSDQHSLFGDSVISGACFLLLDRQPVDARCVHDMNGCPALRTVTDVGRDTSLASQRDQVGDEALFDGVVDLRKPYRRRVRHA